MRYHTLGILASVLVLTCTPDLGAAEATEQTGWKILGTPNDPTETSEKGLALPPLIIRSSETLVFPSDTTIIAADGHDGTSRIGYGTITGGAGQGGQHIVIEAPTIVFEDNVRLIAGRGGDGGHAHALGVPDATAIGGPGGDGGQITLVGQVIGAPHIFPGRGGHGGDAFSEGRGGCDRQPAGHDQTIETPNATVGEAQTAHAQGGGGACAAPGQDGGHGGNATAIGGNGGPSAIGTAGHGGDAIAIAGTGGNGNNACFADEAGVQSYGFPRGGDGGHGGRAIARGGNGAIGYTGGDGGDAYTTSRGGNGGNGTILLGEKFINKETETRTLVEPGSGGTNLDGSQVAAGNGGRGVVGGAGGSASGENFGGDGGAACVINPFTDRAIPAPSGVLVAGPLVTLAALWRGRGKPPHPTTPL